MADCVGPPAVAIRAIDCGFTAARDCPAVGVGRRSACRNRVAMRDSPTSARPASLAMGHADCRLREPPMLIWLALLAGTAASGAALYGHYLVLPAWLTGPAVCQLEQDPKSTRLH